MTIEQIQNQIIEEFNDFDDWMDKYSLLIDLGNNISNFDNEKKTDSNLIQGCQSRVWLYANYSEGKVTYEAESDAVIVKGIIALLIKTLSNQTPQNIIDAELYFIDKIGLKEHLSPTRSNGLLSMIKQMRYYAMAYRTKEKQQES